MAKRKKKIAVQFDEDELFPVYFEVSSLAPRESFAFNPVHVTEEVLDRWRKAESDFKQAQEEIAEALREAGEPV